METPAASSMSAPPAAPPQQAAPPADSGKKRKLEEAGPAGSDLTGEDVRKMVEPLPRQQLLDILQEAAFRHLDVLDDVRRLVDQDPMHRKIFVRGLGWETGADALRAVFSRFGDVEEGVVITDKATGKSRGFGFVTFRHMDGALQALKEPSKRIDGRMTFSLLATTGAPSSQPTQDLVSAAPGRKIYVGNIPFELPADALLNFFSQYGEIEEGPLGFDKQTGRSRGFAFFVYKTPDAARHALEEPAKVIDRHQVFCKLAVDGQKQQPGAVHVQQHGMAASEPSVLQTGMNPAPAQNAQYSSTPQSMLTSGLPYGYSVNAPQNANSSLNLHYNASAGQNQRFGVTSPSATNASSSNLSYSQDISSASSQTAQLSYGAPSYGQLGSYGSQGPAYGGQIAAYPGASAYGVYGATQGSAAPQTTTIQSAGQYGQAASHPTVASAGHYGQMGSYAASFQSATQYGQAASQPMPTAVQYGQVASQSMPAATQYGQVASQAMSAATQYGQVASQATPAATQYGQVASQAMSAATQYGQVASQAAPAATQYGQVASQATSAATQYGQVASQAMPTAAQYGQVVSQAMPTATQYGQVASQAMPTASQYGQVAAQAMPTQSVSQYVQLPSQTTSIQTTGQYVQAPYQNQTLAASAGSRAPTAGISASMPPYYGA